MKILIIRFSSIGDIAWTSPVLRCCKLQIPGVKLHFCTKYVFRDLVQFNPYVDKVHYLNDSLNELIEELKKEDFDYVIDLHGKIRTTIIKLKLGKKSFTYDKLTFKRFLFTKFQINLMPENIHIVDRYMNTVKKLGVLNDGQGLDFFINPQNEINTNDLPAEFRNGYAAYVIGGSSITKKLPQKKMIELCYKIKRPIVLVGGKEDQGAAEGLINYFSIVKDIETPVLYNACGNYGLLQSASFVKQAEKVYGHDTGLTHIAAAFKKKIYSIWGTTSPIGFQPYMADNIIIENNNLNCRPCSKSGRKDCPKGHFKCMNEISLDF